MFTIEKGVEYVATTKERDNSLSVEISRACLLMKANDSFLIVKEKFTKANWEDVKSKYQVKVYVRKCITNKIVNSADYKIAILDSGIRIWYKPKTEDILPKQKV